MSERKGLGLGENMDKILSERASKIYNAAVPYIHNYSSGEKQVTLVFSVSRKRIKIEKTIKVAGMEPLNETFFISRQRFCDTFAHKIGPSDFTDIVCSSLSCNSTPTVQNTKNTRKQKPTNRSRQCRRQNCGKLAPAMRA
jgi:hypothetical protein